LGVFVVDCVFVRALLLSLLAISRGRPHARYHADFPGGSAATAVVVECNGDVVPSAVATAGFVNGTAEVTVAGLTPGTPYSLRCRCVLADPEVDLDTLWSPRVDVVTLDVAGLEVGTPVQHVHRCVCCAPWVAGLRASCTRGGGGRGALCVCVCAMI
jgi:hypothetical protein